MNVVLSLSYLISKVLLEGPNGHSPDLFKVTIIKSEQIFILIIESLNIVRYTLGEIPNISSLELLSCETTILVNAGEKKASVVDEAPLSLINGLLDV